MIINKVIRHEKKLDRSILEENKYVERKIFSFIYLNVLSRLDIREMLSVIRCIQIGI